MRHAHDDSMMPARTRRSRRSESADAGALNGDDVFFITTF
jgi:hypothetical protein